MRCAAARVRASISTSRSTARSAADPVQISVSLTRPERSGKRVLVADQERPRRSLNLDRITPGAAGAGAGRHSRWREGQLRHLFLKVADVAYWDNTTGERTSISASGRFC